MIWAPPSEFVSSSIPSWQILTAHAQTFRGDRDLVFWLKVPLDSLLVWASSEGSGETARMRRLAWTFAARIGYKYQIRLTRSIWYFINAISHMAHEHIYNWHHTMICRIAIWMCLTWASLAIIIPGSQNFFSITQYTAQYITSLVFKYNFYLL